MIKTKVIDIGGASITVAQPTIGSTREFDLAPKDNDDQVLAALVQYVQRSIDRSGVSSILNIDTLSYGEVLELYHVLRAWHYGVDKSPKDVSP